MVAIWINRLYTYATSASDKIGDRKLFWLSLSLIFTAVYSLFALKEAFSGEYVVQDDARQHVFWMLRFFNRELFPNDLIADYFQTVAPTGYKVLYRVAAVLGIEPLLFSKLLPPALHLVTASYCFGITLRVFPVPVAAFCSTLLLSQSLGLTDAVVSGTPKAFIYPLFLAFIYYLLHNSLLPCLGAIAFLGLFYPQMVFIAVGVLLLRLFQWQEGIGFARRREQIFAGLGLAVTVLVMLPYAIKTNQYSPVISVPQARSLPEFFPGGQKRFFYDDDSAKFWLKGRGGIRLTSILTPVTNGAGFLLPLLGRFKEQFPLVQQLRRDAVVLPQIIVASLVMFFAAHALLFRLHLPSRYTEHSLRIVMSIAAGIVLVILGDGALRWAGSNLGRRAIALITTIIIGVGLLFYPAFVDKFPITAYKTGTFPALYEFFRQQPTDSLIASLDDESNNLPTFAERSILVGSEYAIPYHWGYYRQFRKRTLDLITAQYNSDGEVLRDLIRKYGVDFWLLKADDLSAEAISQNSWLMQYETAKDAIAHLQSGSQPALAKTIPSCTVFETGGLIVLDTECMLRILD